MVMCWKGCGRLKAYKQLSTPQAALAAHQAKHAADSAIEPAARAA